jgi:NitT/TauT family transport system substrate-binding protein
MITRRDLLRSIAATAGLLGWPTGHAAAEQPPETTRLRIVRESAICIAPQYAAEELLRAEGFVDVEHVKVPSDSPKATEAPSMWSRGVTIDPVAAGIADIHTRMVSRVILQIDAGEPISVLTGIHSGCFELFGTDRVRSVKDLKDKTVAVPGIGSSHHLYVASIASYVGVDPRKDITFVTPPVAESLQMFRERHPVATKRAVRAILKANDLCARPRTRGPALGGWRVHNALRHRGAGTERTPLLEVA